MTYTVRMRFSSTRSDETWTIEDLYAAKERFAALSQGSRRLDFASLSLTDSEGTVLNRIGVIR